MIGRTRKKQSAGKEAEPETFHLTIIEHQYTSPDAPVKAPEDEIPQRFLNAVDGDIREARRRWDATRKWRETEVCGLFIVNVFYLICVHRILTIF